MNKALNNEQIEGLFKQVLNVVTIISTADLKNEATQQANADKAKADAERAKAEAEKEKADAEEKKNKAEAEKNKEAANKAITTSTI
ncbi:hypothetical protein [Pantoea coffeiphila]|nr:hypothetical protein [Pantoea coffeiphila]